MSPLRPYHLASTLPVLVTYAGLSTLILLHPHLPPSLLAPLTLLAIVASLLTLRRPLRRSLDLLPPIDSETLHHIKEHPLLRRLPHADQQRLLRNCRYFLAEHTISFIPERPPNPKARAIIAVNACLLTLHLPFVEYNANAEIIVYPTAFDPDHDPDAPNDHQGLFHEQGPILFSEEDLLRSLPPRAENPALHEFVHALDFLSGSTDGLPPTFPATWRQLLRQYARDPRQNRALTRQLPPAAFDDEAEFLAYVTEVFFEQPHALRNASPHIYLALTSVYHQSPHLLTPE